MATQFVAPAVGFSQEEPAQRMFWGNASLLSEQSLGVKKRNFLRSLASPGIREFKRYSKMPLRYAGGKSLAVGHVVKHLPEGITQLVSPFIGGGSVEIACANELGISVQAYDVFDILVNYWKVQLREPVKLAERIERWKNTKEDYEVVKERLKQHWRKERIIGNDFSLAAHYWFNHNLSYGPGFLGWMSKIYEDQNRYRRAVDKVRSFRCDNLKVELGSFEATMPKHCRDFLYCDPPYYLDGDSRMFRGIYPQRNFPVHHNGFDHGALRDLLRAHKGGFILSYNDCRTIRDWYADFEIIDVEWQYTMGQGETRIGKNRIENGSYHHVKRSHELLIVGEAHQ